MIDTDLRQYVNESYIKTEEQLIEEAIIEEGAGIELYHTLKNAQKSYDTKLKDFYSNLGQDKNASRQEINTIIRDLENAKAEVNKVDDSSFNGKLGAACMAVSSAMGKISLNLLTSFATNIGFTVASNKLFKSEKLLSGQDIKGNAISTLVGAIPNIFITMKKEFDANKLRAEKIKSEMEHGASKVDAEKKVGSAYKVGIISYLDDQIKEMRKIQVNLA